MSDRDFLFALELPDERHFDAMLRDLTAAVLTHVGYAPQAIDEIRDILRGELKARGGGARCDVRFRVRSGELQITVACAGAEEWRTTRPLP